MGLRGKTAEPPVIDSEQHRDNALKLLNDLWERSLVLKDSGTNRQYLESVRTYMSVLKMLKIFNSGSTDRHAARPEFAFDGLDS